MRVRVFPNERALAQAAAAQAAKIVTRAIATCGKARLLVTSDPAQTELLDALARARDIPWGQVELFHDVELIGVGADHPASRRRVLCDRLIAQTRIGRCHLLDGERDPERVCREEGEALRSGPLDLAFLGLGEHGELALNFPPADLAGERPYLVVRCDAAPSGRALTVSIRQLLHSAELIVGAAGANRAPAVTRCLEGAVSPLAPASVLSAHPSATLFLDTAAAAGLTARPQPEE